MKILSCNSNFPLAEPISKELNLRLLKLSERFSDMEVFVEVKENVEVKTCLLYSQLHIQLMII